MTNMPKVGELVYDTQGWDEFECCVLEVFEDGTILVEEAGLPGTFLQALIEYQERENKFQSDKKIRKMSSWSVDRSGRRFYVTGSSLLRKEG